MGTILCTYLSSGLPWQRYIRFVVWLAVGIIIYLSYGYPMPITMPCKAWSPAMDSVDIPAASPAGIWRLSAGWWRTKAHCRHAGLDRDADNSSHGEFRD
jgi:hypothetical protein